jgi:hypothetical protein
MKYVYLVLLTLCACSQSNSSGSAAKAVTAASCKGVYYTKDAQQVLHKWNQYWQADQAACFTDNLPLSNWETSSAKFINHSVSCTPQAGINSQTLIASNNYYSYRDGKVLLDLDASTGIYRQITMGADADGMPLYSKTEGCFYQRLGAGPDVSYGNQLLLDTDVSHWASTEDFMPFEIFNYTITGPNVSMTRFDSVSDWEYTFCPYLNTPYQYCTALRDGNIMYWPNLAPAVKTALRNEAILIRTKYNWITSSTASFNAKWSDTTSLGTEAPVGAFAYQVVQTADTPYYIDQAWHDYVTGARPYMPDTSSQTSPNICYQGSQNVTLAGGATGKIYGEICYTNGAYVFTQGP